MVKRIVPSWVLIACFVIAVAAFIGGGLWFYNHESQAIRLRKGQELHSIAMLKIQQFQDWRYEREVDARLTAQGIFVQQALLQWMQSPQDATLRSLLVARFEMTLQIKDYQNILLVSPGGDLLLSVDPTVTHLDDPVKELAAKTVNSGEVTWGDFYLDENQEIHLHVAAPILDEMQQARAVLVLCIDPHQYLYPLIQTWPTPSPTAETLLVRRAGDDQLVFLNQLRFAEAAPLHFYLSLSNTEVLGVKAVLGKTGIVEGLDYRGHKVLGDLMPIEGTSWYMVAKVDTSEILADIRTLGLFVALLSLLAVLMTVVLAVYLFSRRQQQLYMDLYHAEQSRRLAQEEIRMTLYSIGDGVITTNAQGCVTRLNPVAEKLTGFAEKDAAGKPLDQVFRIINEHSRKEVESPVERVLREGVVVGLANHTLLIGRDGVERPIADSGAPIRGEDQEVKGVVLVFRDQTSERALQRERALLNYTIATSLNEIYLFDAQTLKFRYVNDGALLNLGYSLDEMKEKTPVDIKPRFTEKSFRQMIQPLLMKSKPGLVFETIHQRADGSTYPVEVHLQLFDYQGEQVFLATINDITEQKQSQQALLESEERYRSLFHHNHAAMLLVNPANGIIIDANNAASEFYGWDQQSLVCLNIRDLMVETDHENSLNANPDQLQVRNARVMQHRKRDGQVCDVEVYSSPVVLNEVSLNHLIIYDISERRRAEKQVAEQLDELRRWHKVTLGREMHIIDLKKEVNQLLAEAGKPPRYEVTGPSESNE